MADAFVKAGGAARAVSTLEATMRFWQSWTGRYPRARRTARFPEFARWLEVDAGGEVAIADGPERRGVPLLDSLVHPRGTATPG